MADSGNDSPAPIDVQLQAAARIFNRGDYFAAGQQFEGMANSATEPELKNLFGALSRIAAGLHLRFFRGGRQGTINLLSQAMVTLEELRPQRAGLNLERLHQELAAFTEELRSGPREFDAGTLKYRGHLFVERRRAPRLLMLR